MFKCLWSEYSTESVRVYIVDGQELRDTVDVNYTEGGHDLVYGGGPLSTEDFIPEGEVWIESDGRTLEMLFSLLHELHERNVMLTGVDYDDAHDDAIVTETAAREAPDMLDAAIRAEIVTPEIIIMRFKGGEGSGHFNHEGIPGDVGGSAPSGGGSGPQLSDRAQRAVTSYKPVTREKRRIATANEIQVSTQIQGEHTKDNAPFDVLQGRNAVEVKTIIDGTNTKITMHGPSLARKVSFSDSNHLIPHTVAIVQTTGQVYYSRGVGSYRLSSMTAVSGGVSGLGRYIKGVKRDLLSL